MQWVRDLVNAVFAAFVSIHVWLWDCLVDVATWGWQAGVEIAEWFNRSADSLVGEAGRLLLSYLPESWAAFLNGRTWSTVVSYFDVVDYMTGAYVCLGIIGTAYAICGTIRAIRWVLACVPTLNLG